MRSRKTQGWEKRLAQFIQDARGIKFQYETHNCAMFAGLCVNVMTEKNYTNEFLGEYKTREQALEFLQSLGYEGLEAIPTKFFGEPLTSNNYAGRGDVVLLENEGYPALGVIETSGKRAVSVGVNGIVFLPLSKIIKAWKV